MATEVVLAKQSDDDTIIMQFNSLRHLLTQHSDGQLTRVQVRGEKATRIKTKLKPG
jgi:hypothetical protein